MNKNKQRPVRGLWDWVMTGSWDGGTGTLGGEG